MRRWFGSWLSPFDIKTSLYRYLFPINGRKAIGSIRGLLHPVGGLFGYVFMQKLVETVCNDLVVMPRLALPRLPAFQDTGFGDDLGHIFLLPIGHDMYARDAGDFLHLIDNVDAEPLAFTLL